MNSKAQIVDIFNKMNFEPKSENISGYESLKNDRQPKSYFTAYDDAKKALEEWRSFPAKKRAYSLHMVSETLVNKSHSLPDFKNELSVLIDYFEFYADMAEQIDNDFVQSVGVVVICLPPECLYIAATVPAALAAGCTVIVYTDKQAIPLFLEEILHEAGLPVGVLNVTDTIPVSKAVKADQIIFFDYHEGATLNQIICDAYKYLIPNNTTALVLESCDLNAAVSEIFHKTWDRPSLWGVSTVVVQESIFQKFMDIMKFKMDHFTSTNSHFKSKKISEKINDAILKAVKGGASVEKRSCNENEWGPTALVNYQKEENLPILNILTCRSAKEGVKLLNNCRYEFGTSVWSEFSAQALEIASELKCPNIWINCHGVFDAKVPLMTAGLNGNCAFGGAQGILEYLIHDNVCKLNFVEKNLNSNNLTGNEKALQAQKAFDSWQKIKNKWKHFKALMDFLEKDEKSNFSPELLKHLTKCTNCPKLAKKNHPDDFFIVCKEEPIGVICFFPPEEIFPETIIFLIIIAVKLGNAVIVVTNDPIKVKMVNSITQFFPKNLLNAITDVKVGRSLVDHPNVKAVWGYENLKNICSKRTWAFIPREILSISSFLDLTINQCTKSKIIWLPKVEKFP